MKNRKKNNIPEQDESKGEQARFERRPSRQKEMREKKRDNLFSQSSHNHLSSHASRRSGEKNRVEKRGPPTDPPRSDDKLHVSSTIRRRHISIDGVLKDEKGKKSVRFFRDKKGGKVKGKDVAVVPDVDASEGKLDNIREDVQFLLPKLKTEIHSYPEKLSGNFKGIKNEWKLWHRFLHKYAQSYGNISKACDFCGISRNHFHRAKERYPTLATLISIVDDRYVDTVEEVMKRHATLPNSVVERIFLLKTHRKEKYGDDNKTGAPVEVSVNFNNIKAMRDGEDKGSDREQVRSSTPAIEVSQG